ncbi:Leucine-rich repeat-containing N-terminal, plant-type [Dillenia turbinata]|uniref:non-specific serine/threonine protein kinase n=1 Tax=Dillenia turbinata TaxID=194707 RepID=A0AAN8W5G6_9MAGN
MAPRIHVFLLVMSLLLFNITAYTNNVDSVALLALKSEWQNTPPNWDGSDPCGENWVGIGCSNSHVTSITLSTMGLIGGLSSDIASLSELQTLDLSNNAGLSGSLTPSIGSLTKLSILILDGCSFSGQIPDTIGSLKELTYLSMYSNHFTGSIPASIGNLINLYWLDVTNNNLTGNIPVSNGTTPGLDLLVGTKHFHFGKNQLNGTIPAQLFSSNMVLIHVGSAVNVNITFCVVSNIRFCSLFDSNQLTGSIPSTLGLVQTLEVVRLDRNHLNGFVPSNLSNLTSVGELHLSNNVLTGPVPNLTGMNSLNYLDLSNNTFDKSDVPLSYSTFQSLTTLMMENTNLQGQVPSSLFSLPGLQTVVLSNNQLDGTLDIGSSNSNQLQLIDLQNNNITNVTRTPGNDVELALNGNPVCTTTGGSESYCTAAAINASYSTPPNNCTPRVCSSNKISSPNCTCAYPYTGVLIFRACSFSDLGYSSYYVSLQDSMMKTFKSNYLPVDSISFSNPWKDSNDYLELNLEIFPSGQDSFNHTGVSWIGFVLGSQEFIVPDVFGPFFFQATSYSYFADASTGSKKSSNTGIVIGASVGGSALVLLVICVGVYALHQRRRAERVNEQSNPFASWDPNKGAGGVPEIKGVRSFSFQELKKYANNFDEANSIGLGGYGKVYKGTLPNGQLVAIKRAQQGSLQGGLEFKTEIELLSRVHHKNLVSLVGFCFEQGEQMLVYEYIPNGTVKDCLSGISLFACLVGESRSQIGVDEEA